MSNLDKTIETLTTKINLSIFRDGKFKISTSDQPLWEIKEHLSMEKISKSGSYNVSSAVNYGVTDWIVK